MQSECPFCVSRCARFTLRASNIEIFCGEGGLVSRADVIPSARETGGGGGGGRHAPRPP